MMNDFFTGNDIYIKEFVRMSSSAGSRADYVQGGGGNTSVKTDDGKMLIKASGFFLSDVAARDAYAVLDCDKIKGFFNANTPETLADPEKEGTAFIKSAIKSVEGLAPLRPSVEAGFHSVLGRFVLHTHSVYANLAGCCADCREIMQAALKDAGYSWGLVDYADPGVMLTFAILAECERVEKSTGKRPAAILMKNHGLIVHGGSADECLRIHADVNERIAREFGISGDGFPAVELIKSGGLYKTSGYIAERLSSGVYGEEFFRDTPLFPDEIVYLRGTLFMDGGDPPADCAYADPKTGRVRLNMSEKNARAVAETIAASIFVADTITAAGRSVSYMGDAARAFIENWESEKYRKALHK